MREFDFQRARSFDEARRFAAHPAAMLLAGGTTLIDLAKCGVAEPGILVDITRLRGLDSIEVDEGCASIGALATMSRVAAHEGIAAAFPAVTQALTQAASAQIRTMATIGGNLMQRTRCAYFRDPAAFPACNKREPGSGCSAIGGITRNHAVLGTSEACIAAYPGDLATALVAFDATIEIGDRWVSADEFFLLPGETPQLEHPLAPGEIITGVVIPVSAAARHSTYLKVRDRQSYEFAAASAAVGLAFEPDGVTVSDIRIALGGVATKPWRARAVEAALRGRPLDAGAVKRASLLAMEGAVDHGANRYKIDLAPRVIARAILTLGGLA